MERSTQNKRVVGNKDDGAGDSVDNSDDSADKQFIHPSQAVNCHSTERSKQNVRVVGNKDN
eukprot:926806-Ditylum_brightwellii.AAC.1